MIDQEKLASLFKALDDIRAILPEVAIIFPETAIVDGVAIAAIPMVERGIGLIFEAASVAQSHDTVDSAKAALAAQIQSKSQATLDDKFPNG